MSFLKAEWRKLILANYSIEPSVLQPLIPNHTELDFWNGRCYVSLVGFMFVNTKMLGLKIPFHVNFEEVNLRFYVKHQAGEEWKRGVVFVKEIVPKPAITLVANTLYKEHYATNKMRHTWATSATEQTVAYEWRDKGSWQKMEVTASKMPHAIEAGSETEFITEHYWGYTKLSDTKTYQYEVTHPTWQAYEVKSFVLNVDFGKVYGQAFEFLNKQQPTSVMLAEGSAITVEQMNLVKQK